MLLLSFVNGSFTGSERRGTLAYRSFYLTSSTDRSIGEFYTLMSIIGRDSIFGSTLINVRACCFGSYSFLLCGEFMSSFLASLFLRILLWPQMLPSWLNASSVLFLKRKWEGNELVLFTAVLFLLFWARVHFLASFLFSSSTDVIA